SLLLCGGSPKKRKILPNARVMIHQPSGGFQGQATDIEIHTKEILDIKRRLNNIYVHHTGQPLKKIVDSMERDNFMSAEDALNFGIVDEIISPRDLNKDKK